MTWLPAPPPVDDANLAFSWGEQCRVKTRVDYEGLHDTQCELKAGHIGEWHYAAEDDMSDAIWWKGGRKP